MVKEVTWDGIKCTATKELYRHSPGRYVFEELDRQGWPVFELDGRTNVVVNDWEVTVNRVVLPALARMHFYFSFRKADT